MKHIKELLGIESFHALVGIRQPLETCSMIDSYISKLNNQIADAKSEIADLESQIDDTDNESNQKQIESLEGKVYEWQSSINELEADRTLISDARKYSASCRSNILEIIDSSLISVNGIYFFSTQELSQYKPSPQPFQSKYLKSSYREIEKNYQKIIDWGQTWDESASVFLDALSNKAEIIDFDKKYLDRFLELAVKIDDHIRMNQILKKSEVLELINLFEDCSYEGLAYRSLYRVGEGTLDWSDEFSNVCWSKSKESIKKVIDSQHHQPSAIKTYCAQVIGLDLDKLIDKFPRLFKELDYGEQEILVVEYRELEPINNFV